MKDQLEADVNYRLDQIRKLAAQGLVDPELGTLTVQGRLLTEHAMRLTPPQNLKQGEKRTAKDINLIFNPVDPNTIKSKSIAKLIRSGNRDAWNQFARNVKKSDFSGTVAVVANYGLHKQFRNKRGRAMKSNFVTLEPDRKALTDYIAKEVKMVGWARAGWLPAYKGLKGERDAGWINRHSPGQGIFQDGRRMIDLPFVSGHNVTSWARRSDEAGRIMNNAIKARANAMRSFYETTMKLVAEGKETTWQAKMRALAAAE